MKTKVSMKTIYLILVISIGLIGLGIGSTYAVFTASAEISNPISFSSNLSYKADIFDTTDITIGPNSSKNVNFAIYNDDQIDGVKYATWYIYDGDSNDIIFEENSSSEIGVTGALDTQGGVIGLYITNNTSNTITLTMGVATSKDEIVLPSYMKLVTITTPSTYTLNLNKGTGVSTIYYKINGASSYTSSTSNVSLDVNSGSTYYYYGVASSGYTMSSCTSSSPCSGTMGTSAVTKSLSATESMSSTEIYNVKIYKSLRSLPGSLPGSTSLVKSFPVAAGKDYTMSFNVDSPYTYDSVNCTNNQVASVSNAGGFTYSITIHNVTAVTECYVTFVDNSGVTEM